MTRKPDDVATRVLDRGTIKWLVTPHLDEGAGLTTGEVIVYPGKGHAPHRHPGEEEVLYVISGKGRQTVGEDTEPFDIAEGDAVYIPRDTLHSTYDTTWSPLRLVVVYTPGGAETGIDELPDATILDAGVAPTWSQSRRRHRTSAAAGIAQGRFAQGRFAQVPDLDDLEIRQCRGVLVLSTWTRARRERKPTRLDRRARLQRSTCHQRRLRP